jgi:hypothetical protein
MAPKCLYDIEVYNTAPREKEYKIEKKSKNFFEYCFDAILCL